jgi:L-ribulose-5-phosphate 3-epimerase
MNRRQLLAMLAAAPMLEAASEKPVFCIFSKHMAQFGYDDLGKHAKQLGFDGVDLTVRDKSHVLPERAEQDLPRALDAIHAHGLKVPMITTNILRVEEKNTRAILSTAAKLKIPFWKPGYHYYDFNAVEESLARVKQATNDLTKLSQELGIVAGFHNHSGRSFGAAVWDIREVIEPLSPEAIGYYFDPAHATIEGGLGGWKISQNLVSKRLKMVALKDFYWAKNNKGAWDVRWCPMGQGMVDWSKVFANFAAIGFKGPLTLHVEYEPADELAAIANDVAFVKKQIRSAYGS